MNIQFFDDIENRILNAISTHLSKSEKRKVLRTMRRHTATLSGIGSENWFQWEIAQACFESKDLSFSFEDKMNLNCDFTINGKSIELKTSKRATPNNFFKRGIEKTEKKTKKTGIMPDLFVFITWRWRKVRNGLRDILIEFEEYFRKHGYVSMNKELDESDWWVLIIKKQ